jgi:hypothetical protein
MADTAASQSYLLKIVHVTVASQEDSLETSVTKVASSVQMTHALELKKEKFVATASFMAGEQVKHDKQHWFTAARP